MEFLLKGIEELNFEMPQSKKMTRYGYLGHLTLIANKLDEYASTKAEIKEFIES